MESSEFFPVIEQGAEMHLTSTDCSVFIAKRDPSANKKRLGYDRYLLRKVPQPTARYLLRCDGTRSHAEIAASLVPGQHPLFGQVMADQALRALDSTSFFSRLAEPLPAPRTFRVTGGFDSYAPIHISFEITETCNFRCDHCYVSASPEKHGRRDGEGTKAVLDKLAASGVRVIELTGGECTTHPEFKEILLHAAEKFHLVAIISNGFLLGKRRDLAELVASLPNVLVQISIDGGRAFHDDFRKMPGSFDAACEAVRFLREKGTFVRVGMSVGPENLDQVLEVYRAAKQLGASALGLAPVTSFGRGTEVTSCSSQIEHEVQHKLAEIIAPFADDPLFDAVRSERTMHAASKEINCGAGWRSFALNSNGTIRSCLFLADSKKFGNIDNEAYDQIFRHPAMNLFHDAPSPGGPECSGPQPDGSIGCKHIATCTGCFAKAFRISQDEYPECPWRATYFPGMSLGIEKEVMVPLAKLVRRPTAKTPADPAAAYPAHHAPEGPAADSHVGCCHGH